MCILAEFSVLKLYFEQIILETCGIPLTSCRKVASLKKNLPVVVLVVAIFALSMLLSAKVTAQSTGSGSFQFVNGTDYYTSSDIAMPPKGVTFTDPNFHTSIVRMTDKSDGYSDTGIENEYSRIDPENCNGSFVILRGNQAEVYLYDTATFQMKKHIENIFLGEEPEPRWDPTDPKIFYYVYGTELRTYNIDNDVSTTVHDFHAQFPNASYITTKVEGDASLDRRYWSFMVEDSDYNLLSVIVYDKAQNSIVGQLNTFPDALDWTSMDMSGSHCLIGYDSHDTQVFSRDLTNGTDLPHGAAGHMDLAETTDGGDVIVYQNTATDWIAMADLNTLQEVKLVKIPFDVNPDIGMHFSGNSAKTPGWVLVSTYGCKNPPTDSTHSWMDTQLFMLELRPNGTLWRIAHTNSFLALDFNAEKNYFAECFAAINTQGTRIYYGSNWANFATDYTDTYMITIPQEWHAANVLVPEFPSLITLPLLLAMVIALMLHGRKFARKTTA